MNIWLLPEVAIQRSRSSTATSPAGGMATRPPLSSGAQISNVEASNDTGAISSTVVAGPSSVKSVSRTRRSTARCGTATPFGRPVEPEV